MSRVECLEFRGVRCFLDEDVLAVDDVEACRGGLGGEATAIESEVGD